MKRVIFTADPRATDYMRLSADIRFHRADSAVDPRWTSDWSSDDGY
jgi:hypothetical protein